MSSVEGRGEPATDTAGREAIDLKLEVVVVPVSDVDRAAHGKHGERIGAADPKWPDWYALYMVREQAGEELPS